MRKSGYKFSSKKIIVFSYEGKNNKTESIYFSHFLPHDDNCVIKQFSSGVTDPIKMVKETKSKRKEYDYYAKEDRTFIFIDGDNKEEKMKIISELKNNVDKDITIIVSNPCFEIWFLNHFVKTTRQFANADEVIDELKKYIPNYKKNGDYYDLLLEKRNLAIKNSKYQSLQDNSNPTTDVWTLLENNYIEDK